MVLETNFKNTVETSGFGINVQDNLKEERRHRFKKIWSTNRVKFGERTEAQVQEKYGGRTEAKVQEEFHEQMKERKHKFKKFGGQTEAKVQEKFGGRTEAKVQEKYGGRRHKVNKSSREVWRTETQV
jgi:hypothetical protein